MLNEMIEQSTRSHARKILAINLTIIFMIGPGWLMNLVKLTQCDFNEPYKAEFVHTVGLIPPIGAITGWLDLGK